MQRLHGILEQLVGLSKSSDRGFMINESGLFQRFVRDELRGSPESTGNHQTRELPRLAAPIEQTPKPWLVQERQEPEL